MPHLSKDACPFCEIAASSEPRVVVVAEGKHWVAFFPEAPANLGHTLVIPRQHVADFLELGPTLAAELIEAARSIGLALRAVFGAEGLNLVTSAGEAAEQTVFHLHFHVLPRWRRDGIRIWPESSQTRSGAELQAAATRIRRALSAAKPD